MSEADGRERFSTVSFEDRKRVIRDILCSFDKDILPSEYRNEEYDRITDHQARRDAAEWTVQGDLETTLLQWGVHDVTGWKFANQLNTRLDRARLFREKLKRRFNEQLTRYDGLARLEDFTRDGRSMAVSRVLSQVSDICEQLRYLVQAAAGDLQLRPEGRLGTTSTLLETLHDVCRRNTDIFFEWRSSVMGPAGAEEEMSLFHHLINGGQTSTSSDFMLDVLDSINANWPWILGDASLRDHVIQINGFLLGKGARPRYQARFQDLLVTQRPSSGTRPGA